MGVRVRRVNLFERRKTVCVVVVRRGCRRHVVRVVRDSTLELPRRLNWVRVAAVVTVWDDLVERLTVVSRARTVVINEWVSLRQSSNALTNVW